MTMMLRLGIVLFEGHSKLDGHIVTYLITISSKKKNLKIQIHSK